MKPVTSRDTDLQINLKRFEIKVDEAYSQSHFRQRYANNKSSSRQVNPQLVTQKNNYLENDFEPKVL